MATAFRPSPVLATLLATLLAACGRGGEAGAGADVRRSALLVTLDTTNPNALDVYGEDRGLTPHLTALARESVVYERARAVAPLTMPSHGSMLTGLYPVRHTVRDNGWLALPASADTLAERARAAGFRTGAFVAAAVLRASYGLAQGFETFDEAPQGSARAGGIGERSASAVTDAAIAWIAGRAPGRPYFLWVHYFDPHAPYDPPAECLARAGGRPYLGEVVAVDDAVGRLLDRLRREPDFERTVVIVVADHGESVGRHGESSHGLLAYDATLSVPLLVRFPDRRRAGERSQEIVSGVDVFSTLLGAMGLPVPSGVDGIDLGAGPAPHDRGVYFESYYGYLNYGWSPLAGWADAESKYIHGARPELYLADDEAEERDLYDPADPRVQRAREALGALTARPTLARAADEHRTGDDDDDMAALGYAAAASGDVPIPAPLDDLDLPAPADHLTEHYRSWEALALADAGRLSVAIDALREIADANPGNAFAHERLGELLLRAERPEEALVPLRAMIARGLERPNLRQHLARAYSALGRYAEAIAELDRYLELCPGDAEALQARAALAKRLPE